MVHNVKITMRSGAVIQMSVERMIVDRDRKGAVRGFRYRAAPGSQVPFHIVAKDIESVWVEKESLSPLHGQEMR